MNVGCDVVNCSVLWFLIHKLCVPNVDSLGILADQLASVCCQVVKLGVELTHNLIACCGISWSNLLCHDAHFTYFPRSKSYNDRNRALS